MRKFAKSITMEELGWAIAHAFIKNGDSLRIIDRIVPPSECKDVEEFLSVHGFRSGKYLTKKIEEDLGVVDFDDENSEWQNGEGYIGALTGFHTLPNGLTLFGMTAGGDWECPLYYIIYYDGEQLRGYIPKEGNLWNTDKNSAYGNNQETDDDNPTESPDDKNSRIRFGVPSEDLKAVDNEKILADIQENIVFDDSGIYKTLNSVGDIDIEQLKSEWEHRKQEESDRAKAYMSQRGSMSGTMVMVMQERNDAPKQAPVPTCGMDGRPICDVDGKTIFQILEDAESEAKEIARLIGELKEKKINVETFTSAVAVRDVNMRKLVALYCTALQCMQTYGE